MIKINMFSSAEKVPGQGVASAYRELVNLMRDRLSNKYEVYLNTYRGSDISHYHTIDFTFYLSTFLPNRGRRIGYVHFLPETVLDSLRLPWPASTIFARYIIRFYKRMDALVVVNPAFIPDLIKAGIPESKITYIPNFVNPKNFYDMPAKQKAELRKSHDIPAKQPVVISAGQVQTRKGVLDFIELAKRNPDFLFIWAGGFSFGVITEGYEELSKHVKNPPANLRFPGILPRNEMNDYLNMADLFLLPSYNELFPMSALEAFSTHTPVMLRDLDLYKHVIDGYYIPATDVDAMDTKLKTFFSNTKERTKYKKLADDASAYYSPKRVAKLWDKFYAEQFQIYKDKKRK